MASKIDIAFEEILDSREPGIYDLQTNAPGPEGSLPLAEEMLLNWPSGDIFAMTQNAGMGWATCRTEPKTIPPVEHSRRNSRSRWHTDCAWLPHGTLGNRFADAGSGA